MAARQRAVMEHYVEAALRQDVSDDEICKVIDDWFVAVVTDMVQAGEAVGMDVAVEDHLRALALLDLTVEATAANQQ